MLGLQDNIDFGKYIGHKVIDVLRTDIKYFIWLYENTDKIESKFSNDVVDEFYSQWDYYNNFNCE